MAKKLHTDKKLTTLNTAFTDNFCPLTNVSQEPTTGILTAQITTSHRHYEHFDEYSSSATDTAAHCVEPAIKRTRLRKNLKRQTENRVSPIRRYLKTFLPTLRRIVFLCLIFVCAAMWPSILALPYLLFFLFFMSKWAVCRGDKTDSRMEHGIKVLLIFYLACHILLSYLYQFHLFQLYTPADSLVSRLLGLSEIVYTKCEQPAHFYVSADFKWQQLANSFALFALYWFLTIEFSYSKEHSNQESFLSPPKSPPIPLLPSIAVGRVIKRIVIF